MARERIAFIGLGGMGGGMAARLAESGYDMAVYNRTRAKGEPLAELGARVADSPADAARDADVVMLSLADQHVVTTMLYGPEGAVSALPAGGRIVDMSTVPPSFARQLGAKAAETGHSALDACVLGAPQHARTGELRVMVGGEEAAFDGVRPILETIGKEVVYLGVNGLGASMKLVLNMLMGVQMPALAEAVVLGERAGLPRDKILEMIAKSGYSSPVMSFRCPMMAERTFGRAAFKLSLMRKDMMLVLEQAQELSVPLPVTESAYAMLTAAKQQGLGDLDVSAILAFQERLAGMNDYPWPEPGPPDGGRLPGASGPPGGGRPPGASGLSVRPGA
ncbi:MAG: NAD(P)-dependent oxidoreductase [Actinobacteria bacterium]|nr:NAD(P)-dependent oxidoreductase [Actinomycetota bacterium]